MKKFTAEVSIYKTYLTFIICPLAQAEKWVEKEMPEFFTEFRPGCGKCFGYKGGPYTIWVESGLKTKELISTLAHECLHAASLILRDRGFSPDADHDEPLNYLFEYLFGEALKKVKLK